MEMQTLKVTTRTEKGKGAARRRRSAGDIPAVVYGEGADSLPIIINAKVFDLVVHGSHGEHAVVQVEVEDKPELSGPSMIKDVQHHPIHNQVVHADFQRIKLDKPIQTLVPIVLIGRSIGIIEGGVPDQHLRELEVECLPLDTPDHFDVDITNIAIGGLIHVSDLEAPEGLKILTDGERTIIAIHPPKVIAEDTVDEEGEVEGEGEGEAEAAPEAGAEE